ncbi:PepSY-like domain-containing protein [Sphingobacterium sp. SRCM116780]|uniref:PepSY-like domain-containing protein n=1 Tax=Sphingobacterium sp. SRCM116780 TaxID=2907623 RepID=UPI001F3C1942|nr:PepSY-like domain-containing protein [Sphingobacterium sp. SRCM116780]UIR54725.1 PepSY-like domain-containing protein [Sphingobacterium sp. SRCM116780]
MNRIKSMAIVVLVALSTSGFAQKKVINSNQLPANAQTFIKNNFSTNQISSIIEETENLFYKEYKIILKNGTKIDFDKTGNWEEVDGENTAIPLKIVPTAIKNYIAKSFPDTQIVKIKQSNRKYEVEISNGLELQFNKKGQFIKIDD